MLGMHLHKFLAIRVLTVALVAVMALVPAMGGRLRLACADPAMASCDLAMDDHCPLGDSGRSGKQSAAAVSSATLAESTGDTHACCHEAKASPAVPAEPIGGGPVLLPRDSGPIPDCCIVRSSAPASMPPIGRAVAAADVDVQPLLPSSLSAVVSVDRPSRWTVIPVGHPPPCPAAVLSTACLAAQPPPARA
jgi:hypothetical protein